jgi:hypothetical protein
LVGCTSQQTDGFLPLRAFKLSSSESADRGRSIIQVTLGSAYINDYEKYRKEELYLLNYLSEINFD